MNKTLVQMTRGKNTLLLRFDDGEIMKFVALIGSPGTIMAKKEPTDEDLFLVSATDSVEREAKDREADLLVAWQMWVKHGPGAGFAKPKKFPGDVIRKINLARYASVWPVVSVIHENIIFGNPLNARAATPNEITAWETRN